MRPKAIRASLVLAAILPLPLTVLAAQAGTTLSINEQVGEIGVIHAQAQERSQGPSGQTFSLRNGVTIHLSGDWEPDTYDRIPTPWALEHRTPRELAWLRVGHESWAQLDHGLAARVLERDGPRWRPPSARSRIQSDRRASSI